MGRIGKGREKELNMGLRCGGLGLGEGKGTQNLSTLSGPSSP